MRERGGYNGFLVSIGDSVGLEIIIIKNVSRRRWLKAPVWCRRCATFNEMGNLRRAPGVPQLNSILKQNST